MGELWTTLNALYRRPFVREVATSITPENLEWQLPYLNLTTTLSCLLHILAHGERLDGERAARFEEILGDKKLYEDLQKFLFEAVELNDASALLDCCVAHRAVCLRLEERFEWLLEGVE